MGRAAWEGGILKESPTTADAWFEPRPCIVCEGTRQALAYPISKPYASGHSGIDLSQVEIGVARCASCGHLSVQPMPNQAFLERFYSSYMTQAKGSYYRQQQAPEIAPAFRAYYAPWLRRCRQLRPAARRLADVGCGMGMFLRLAREMGFEVFGIEPSPEASRLREQHGLEVAQCLIEQFAPTERFDVVTMWDLLEHLADPRPALAKIAAALHPQGLLVLEIPVRDSLLHILVRALYSLSGGKLSKPLLGVYGIHHLHYFSAASIRRFLGEHGFRVVETRRSETNLVAKRLTGWSARALLGNVAMACLFGVARLLGRQNKLIVIAEKSGG